MALSSTVRRFEIELADSDRGVYESLDLRVAQHPSESERYLVARVLVRAFEHAEGVDFSKGLGASDEPALWQHDLTGKLLAWIEIGSPSADRLHKASKACGRVAVYGWKGVDDLARELTQAKVHRAEAIEIHGLDASLLDAIVATLDRNNRWALSISGGAIYLDIAGKSYEGAVTRVAVA